MSVINQLDNAAATNACMPRFLVFSCLNNYQQHGPLFLVQLQHHVLQMIYLNMILVVIFRRIFYSCVSSSRESALGEPISVVISKNVDSYTGVLI